MRTIVQFIDKLNVGGKERQLVDLTKLLSRRGDYMTYVVSMEPGLFYTELGSFPRVRIVYLLRRTRKDPMVFLRFLFLCRKWKPCVITVWNPMTAIYALPAAKLLGIKLVSAFIQDAPEVLSKVLRRRSRLVFALADAVVANSLAGIRAYGPPIDKTTLILAGYDPARLGPVQDPDFLRREFKIHQKYIIGMVAAFALTKDQPTLIEAARILLRQRRDVVFVMVGSGPTLESCRALVAPEEAANIRFLGEIRVPTEQIISAFDVGTLITYTEGISNSILEYMSRRKPVVATEGGGTSELVVDGVTGFLVPRRDPERLAELLVKLLDDQELRRRMGEQGRLRIAQDFSPEHTVDRYRELYDRLMSSDQ